MKNISLFCLLTFFAFLSAAQDGRVVYERSSQMQIRVNDGSQGIENSLPRTRIDRLELLFSNGQTLWRALEREEEQDQVTAGDGGMQVRMVVAGSDDVLYTDLNKGIRVEKREFLDRKFIIDDSVRNLKWKMTGETRMVLKWNCMKATTTEVRSRLVMSMENGKMERKEIQDTMQIIAWFTSEIPLPLGPAEYQGQLPGLILEMDINNGRQTYRATEVEDKVEQKEIKAPEGKKRYTPEEFRKERDKMMEEMQRNNRGGNRVIRMG